MSIKKVTIIGVGNIPIGNEGVGVHVVRKLVEMELPKNVKVYDGGTRD